MHTPYVVSASHQWAVPQLQQPQSHYPFHTHGFRSYADLGSPPSFGPQVGAVSPIHTSGFYGSYSSLLPQWHTSAFGGSAAVAAAACATHSVNDTSNSALTPPHSPSEPPQRNNEQTHDWANDERLTPKLRMVMASFKDKEAEMGPPPETLEQFWAFSELLHTKMSGMGARVHPDAVDGVEITTHKVPTLDNKSEIEVFLYYPKCLQGGANTCLYAMHGGGFIAGSVATSHNHYSYVASKGIVVAAVEYRLLRPDTRYPTQLDDCEAGLRWLLDHKHELRVGKVVLQGESAGATLALALPFRLQRKGGLDLIAGTVAMVPMVGLGFTNESRRQLAGERHWKLEKHYAAVYGTDREAWPVLATDEQLAGYPKTLIITAEADLLHDEGIAFGRRLRNAGVDAAVTTVHGAVHSSCLAYKLDKVNYENFWQQAVAFAKSV